jgi:hypothetical protein
MVAYPCIPFAWSEESLFEVKKKKGKFWQTEKKTGHMTGLSQSKNSFLANQIRFL